MKKEKYRITRKIQENLNRKEIFIGYITFLDGLESEGNPHHFFLKLDISTPSGYKKDKLFLEHYSFHKLKKIIITFLKKKYHLKKY